MKKKLLLLSLVAFTALQVNAQNCTESVTNFGNNQNTPSYNVSGDVEVIFNSINETVTLNLGSNYSTANGPDVRVYLINSNGMSDNQLRNVRIQNLENISFGLTNSSGAGSFTVSAPSNIGDFDKVFFYCFQFNAFWDFGSFTPFSTANCSILNTQEPILSQNISVFPNPTNEQFEVRNTLETPISVSVYTILGKQVQTKENTQLKNQTVSLSNLNSGVYLVEIKSDTQRIIKKLIKR